MKKKMLSLAIFLTAFAGTYLIICFAIPGMRITLDAAPPEYFLASVSHMALFKTAVSLAAALILGAIPLILGKQK